MRIFRRVLRRIGIRAGRAVARRGRLIGVVFLAGAICIAANALGLGPPVFEISVQSAAAPRPTPDPEPPATATYLRGQQTYDAELVWEAYSERALRDLQRRGATIEDLQRQLDRARDSGTRIEQARYVGGSLIPDGSLHFYVVTRSVRARNEISYVPYIFTLDSRGKIDQVD